MPRTSYVGIVCPGDKLRSQRDRIRNKLRKTESALTEYKVWMTNPAIEDDTDELVISALDKKDARMVYRRWADDYYDTNIWTGWKLHIVKTL
jgi:hypothetical protein